MCERKIYDASCWAAVVVVVVVYVVVYVLHVIFALFYVVIIWVKMCEREKSEKFNCMLYTILFIYLFIYFIFIYSQFYNFFPCQWDVLREEAKTRRKKERKQKTA